MEPAYLPRRLMIDAYGNGGFRFDSYSHRGGLLILPSGTRAWPVISVERLTLDDFNFVLQEIEDIELLLIGTGERICWLAADLHKSLRDKGLRMEMMDTGAAARTYNVLLREGRRVSAALIAVE